MKKRGTCICTGGCFTTSLVFLALAITIFVLIQVGFFKETLDNYIREQTTLEPGHETYKQWVNPTIPMYKDFFIFNLTNPKEFADGAKPKFDELGPYRYREIRQKTILNEANGTITYLMNRSFHFEHSSENNYTENDIITTINFAFVTAVYNAQSFLKKTALQALIETVRPKPELLIKTSVHELLWDYTDPLLKRLHWARQIDTPHIYLQLNNSYSDRALPSMVHSGTVDSKETAQFIEWAGLKQLPYWKNEANFINASTSGIIWHSLMEKDEKLEAFISDVNRTFHIHYQEEVSVEGIDAYRFRVEDSDFRPDSNYHTDNSTPVGLIFLGVLQKPVAPVFGSKPHFLDCDPSLYNAVEGVSPPDRNRHDVVVDIEPITGASINVHLRLQINVNVTKTSFPFFPSFRHVTPVIFPMFYLDEHATIDDGLKSKLNEMVFVPLTAVNSSIWVVFGLCCFISLLTGLCTLRWCIKLYRLRDRQHPERIRLLDKTDS